MAKNNYLFVCSANIHRSKTGKIVFEEMCKEKGLTIGSLEDSLADVYVGSKGVAACMYGNSESEQYIRGMDKKHDLVFAANTDIAQILIEMFRARKEKVVNLLIDDVYDTNVEWQYRELRDVLRVKLEKYLPEKS